MWSGKGVILRAVYLPLETSSLESRRNAGIGASVEPGRQAPPASARFGTLDNRIVGRR